MALNINGTTGISGVDGSASAPAVTGTDSNTGINFASDTVNINTGGTTRVTVDSAGAVGIGTTTPTNSFANADDLVVGDGSGHRGMTILAGTSGISGIEFSDGTGSDAAKTAGGIRYDHSGSYMRFNTNDGSERMRIDSSGNLLIGTTSTPDGSADGMLLAGGAGRALSRGSTAMRYQLMFYNPNGMVGRIDTTGSSTNYLTSSDYRLKENVTVISDGITRLKTLKPSRFNFIADATKTVDGFLAHEVTAVPEAIAGTKDEVDSDNNPVYQGIDQSKIVPLLTAALQEAIAKIEVLETKVAALDAG